VGINGIDWLHTDTKADLDQEHDNREYNTAKCKESHEDGTSCLPSWDGFMYVCLDRIARNREHRSGRPGS
jgi:hypothetical protein